MSDAQKGPPDGCPDLEEIAAHVDGHLTGREKAAVAAHLAQCEECYSVFAETARFQGEKEAGSAEVARPRFGRNRLVLAITSSLAAAAIAGVVILRPELLPLGPSAGHSAAFRELVKAVGTSRPIEPRLTGGFAWGEPKPALRGSIVTEPSWQVLAAAAKLKSKGESSTSPNAARELAAAELILGKADAAIARLEEAAQRDPKNAKVQSDLAAAYLVRARTDDRAQDIAKAVERAADAAALDPTLPEALFNRALGLESLGLSGEARKAWQAYLDADPSSAWSGEVRRRLDQPPRPSRSEMWSRQHEAFVQAAYRKERTVLEDGLARFLAEGIAAADEELLPRWAEAWRAARYSEATETLAALREVADAVEKKSGDRLLDDATTAIEKASLAKGRGNAAATLAEAHLEYRRAAILNQRAEFEKAAAGFTRVRLILDGVSPYAWLAESQLGIAAYRRGELVSALASLEQIGVSAREHGYRLVSARADWMQGLILLTQDRLTESLSRYERALEDFATAGDTQAAVAIHGLLAENLELLGEPNEGWRHRVLALRGLPDLSSAIRQHALLHEAAVSADGAHLERLALHFHNALVDLATKSLPSATCEASLARSGVRAKLGDRLGAFRDMQEARESLQKIADMPLHDRLSAEMSAREGNLETPTEPKTAERHLTDAINYFERGGHAFRLAELRLTRGRALSALGEEKAAEADFDEAIAAFESGLDQPRGFQASYFSRSEEIFDELVRFEAFTRLDPRRALEAVERGRGRGLLASLRANGDSAYRPLDVAALQHAVPAKTAFVYYTSLDDRILSWAVTHNDVEFESRPVGSAALEALVESYRNSLFGSDTSVSNRLARSLYELLVQPLAVAVGSETLIFIPDLPLWRLPFAALMEPATGRYLVETHIIEVAPSGTTYAAARRAALGLGVTSSARLLVVGSPRTDGTSRKGLPGAERESDEISSIYRTSVEVTGADATKERILREGPVADVLHFAGHGLAGEMPGHTYLVLAPGDGRPNFDRLEPRDVTKSAFGGLRLAVLAACGTADGPRYRGEGALSVGWSFLAASVPAVVASLWEIPDEPSRLLFVAFHKALRQGRSPAQALRTAQIELITAADAALHRPSIWAAATALGSADVPICKGDNR